MKKFLQVSSVFLILASFFFLVPVHAVGVDINNVGVPQNDQLGLSYGQATGLGNTDVRLTAARIINVVLGVLGILTTILILYAGFTWMTAGGNDEKITKAKGTIFAAVIGLLVILSAYAISSFVLKNLYKATTDRIYVQ